MAGLTIEVTKDGAPIAFLIAGVVALPASYSYLKLTLRFPGEGGTVAFLKGVWRRRHYGSGDCRRGNRCRDRYQGAAERECDLRRVPGGHNHNANIQNMHSILRLGPILRAPVAMTTLLCVLALVPATASAAQTRVSQDTEATTDHIAHDLEAAVAKMRPLVQRYGYIGVAGAVLVEGFGMPAPGQTLLMAGALEATGGRLHIGLLLLLAVAAAVTGNSLGYLIGKIGGRPLLRKLRVNEVREAKIAALFERYGGGFILLARFLDGPRQLNGIIAGTLEMRWWVFTVFNILGAVLWVSVWGLGTYYLSEHLHAIDAFIRQLNPWAIGIAVLGVLSLVVYLLLGRKGRAD